jgi:putative tryptophan/tyrosine transport system substrate-binding protein
MTLRRRHLLTLFIATLPISAAMAQDKGRVPRIGIIDWMPATTAGRMSPMQQALRDLGLVDGQNIAIVYRSAEEQSERLDALARELAAQDLDILIAVSTPAAHAAARATRTMPIVATSADPLGTGLVSSLARPGGNITGLSTMLPELASKRLELLREVFPHLARVGFLGSSHDPAAALFVRETQAAAARFAIQVDVAMIDSTRDLERGIADLARRNCDAIIVQPIFLPHRARLAAAARQAHVPMISDFPSFAEAGSLLSYGPDMSDTFERLASYVDKLLKGAKPGDLPIAQPSTFRLVVNLRTAREFGITISPAIIARADEVIE